MEFHDADRQLTYREAADELHRFAGKIAALAAVSERISLPRDAADILNASERDRLVAFYRRRLTNVQIEAIETRMAQEAFGDDATSLSTDTDPTLADRARTARNSSGATT